MNRQPSGVLPLVAALTCGIFAVAFLALMLAFRYNFSPALFLALVVATAAAVVLYIGMSAGRGGAPVPPEEARRAGMAPSSADMSDARRAGTAPTAADARSGAIHRAGMAPGPRDAGTAGAGATATARPGSGGERDGAAWSRDAQGGRGDARPASADFAPVPAPPPPAPTGAMMADPAAADPLMPVDPVDQAASAMRTGMVGPDGRPVAAHAVAVKPRSLDAPRGRPDDLKRIGGIGPRIEAMLHDMGYWHFDQIAGWTPGEVAWVDGNLQGFDGRVTRDDWVSQARILAAGGDTGVVPSATDP